MSSVQEKKFLQLIKFSFDLSVKVIRHFTKTNVLNSYNNSFSDFLNTKKHEIYHLWINNIRCCVCTSNISLKKDRDLIKDQFTKLFDIKGNSVTGHVKRGHGNSFLQHCLCRISCLQSCSLEDLDITLITTLLQKLVKLNPDDEMWLITLRKIRNDLAHAVSTTYFDQGELENLWLMLEDSVLGLARKIPQEFYVDNIQDQIKLLGKADFNISDGEIETLIKIESKKLYDQIIEQNKKLQQIAEEQQMQAEDMKEIQEAIKEDIMKQLKQITDELIEIRKLTFLLNLHGIETAEQSEGNETPQQKADASECCKVEWKLKTPDTWRVDQIKKTLENVSGMLSEWFKIEFIYVGSLVINTSMPRHVLRDRIFLKSTIKSFLEKIVEVCEINTDVPEIINVDFQVLDITSQNVSGNSKAKSRTDDDIVTCKHCHKQFLCDQCSQRRQEIEFLVDDNRQKIQKDTEPVHLMLESISLCLDKWLNNR